MSAAEEALRYPRSLIVSLFAPTDRLSWPRDIVRAVPSLVYRMHLWCKFAVPNAECRRGTHLPSLGRE